MQAGIHEACCVGPKPLAQPPAFPPQDPRQWAGEGGVILYPSHKPQGSTTGRPRIPGGPHKRGKEGKEAGRSQPQPGASAMAPDALGRVPGGSPGMWVIGCPHPERRG